ncbi:unnamed protein product, partial [Adineta steineri]
ENVYVLSDDIDMFNNSFNIYGEAHETGSSIFNIKTAVSFTYHILPTLSMNEPLIDYFEETYMGRLRSNHTRRKPMFDIEYWNTYNRTTRSSMRMN